MDQYSHNHDGKLTYLSVINKIFGVSTALIALIVYARLYATGPIKIFFLYPKHPEDVGHHLVSMVTAGKLSEQNQVILCSLVCDF